MSLDDLNSPATRISRNQLIQCYRNAVALSRDPHLPYTIGSSVHLSAYGMYGYAMLCSTDFRRTMEFAVRYHQLATPLATIAFHERDRIGTWTIEPLLHPRIDSLLYRFVTELQIATHISLHRDIMGESFKPREISLPIASPRIFRSPRDRRVSREVRASDQSNRVRFSVPGRRAQTWQSDNLSFSDRAVRRPDRRPCPAVRRGRQGSQRAVDRRRERPSLASRRQAAQDDAPHAQATASSQNTSFRELSDELRVHVALRYLRETTMTIEDIAFALGI